MSAVPIELFDHLLLLAAVICAASLVRVLQRREGIGRAYAILVGGELLLAVFSIAGDRFVGTVVLALVVATVVIPWLLEHVSRWAFARGHLVWVARVSSLRASLMPGANLARQLPILDGLALLERDGVDAALSHFRRLADATEDGVELAMIQEQIISMLFHSHRWDEGIAYYERRFRAGYAAIRPTLALGLLRAYGESGQLETAALLLRELEDGPVGSDPKTAEILGQARLTFLAYAGAVAPVDEVVQQQRFTDLGLTAATAALFKGIAQARAGVLDAAVETLNGVEALAGPRDGRVLEAAQSLLEQAAADGELADRSGDQAGDSGGDQSGVPVNDLDQDQSRELAGDGARDLAGARGEPERQHLSDDLRAYVELVATRLELFLGGASPGRRRGRPLATYLIIAAFSTVYGVHLLRGGGGIGLLEVGALSEDLWRAGAWNRVLTSAWIHTDLIGLLFDAYAIWLSGQIIERILGRSRMILISVGAGCAAMAASVLALPTLWSLGWQPLAVVVPTGANLMALGASVGALWLLLPRYTPQIASRVRRNLALTLGLLLVANLLTSWPGIAGLGVAPVAVVVAAAIATGLVLGLPVTLPRWARGLQAGLAALLLAANLVGFVMLVGDEPEAHLVDHRVQRCQLGPVVVDTPLGFVPTTLDRELPLPLPLIDGVVDGLELRDGGVVQFGAWPGASEEGLALFEAVEGLDGELSVTAAGRLPEAFAEIMANDEVGSWQAADLWRNGERVGRVIERRIRDGERRATVYLVATPARAIEHGGLVYAALLGGARLGAAGDGRVRCSVE